MTAHAEHVFMMYKLQKFPNISVGEMARALNKFKKRVQSLTAHTPSTSNTTGV